MLLITDNTLANNLVSKRGLGLKVRGVLDADDPDSGGDFNLLEQNGVDVHLDPNPGLLHHKYAIVDAEFPNSEPWVIVGSHNWTASADGTNDENTLLIQDARIANLFLQEFAARYYEAGGQDSIVVSTGRGSDLVPKAFKLEQNFPNPFNPATTIVFELPSQSIVSLSIFNVLGERVATLVNETLSAGRYQIQWSARGISSGVYIYRLVAKSIASGSPSEFTQSRKILLLR